MKYNFLGLFAILILAGCSHANQAKHDVTHKWNSMTNKEVTEEDFNNYSKIIFDHSKESFAKYSIAAVEFCQMNDKPMTYQDYVVLIHKDYKQAQKCWDSLNDYTSRDVRFYKKDPEQAALEGFDKIRIHMGNLIEAHKQYYLNGTLNADTSGHEMDHQMMKEKEMTQAQISHIQAVEEPHPSSIPEN